MISPKRGKVIHNYIVWVYKRDSVDDLAVWLWDGGFPHGMLVEGCVCFPGSMMMAWKAAMGWWSWCTTSLAFFICFLKHHDIKIYNDGSIAEGCPPTRWKGMVIHLQAFRRSQAGHPLHRPLEGCPTAVWHPPHDLPRGQLVRPAENHHGVLKLFEAMLQGRTRSTTGRLWSSPTWRRRRRCWGPHEECLDYHGRCCRYPPPEPGCRGCPCPQS